MKRRVTQRVDRRYFTILDVLYLEKQQDSTGLTRGHSLKLINKGCHYDLRKFSLVPRIVNI